MKLPWWDGRAPPHLSIYYNEEKDDKLEDITVSTWHYDTHLGNNNEKEYRRHHALIALQKNDEEKDDTPEDVAVSNWYYGIHLGNNNKKMKIGCHALLE